MDEKRLERMEEEFRKMSQSVKPPNVNTDFPQINPNIFKGIDEARERKAEAERAMIEMAKNSKPNWAERNPIKMLLIGAVIGFLLNYILEILKVYQAIGLKKG